MKAKILAGAIGAFFYGTSGLAADGDCPPPRAGAEKVGEGVLLAQSDTSPSGNDYQENDLIIETQPVPDSSMSDDSGTGGSGAVGQEGSTSQGGTPQGEVYLNMPLRCQPSESGGQGTGGSGTGGSGTGGSGMEQQPLTPPPPPSPSQSGPQPRPEATPGSNKSSESYPTQDTQAFGGSGVSAPSNDFRPASEQVEPLEVKKKEKNKTKGLTVTIGGGIEGYTGALAPQLNPGPTAGVTASFKPTRQLGLEVGYTGALNNIDAKRGDVVGDSPDLVRNGGQAVLTVGLTPTAVQPYILGGIGISNYNFRHGEALGYRDDTVGNVPAGLGVRGYVGHFTVDARANYNFLFDKDFAPGITPGTENVSGGGSYQGTVSVGGTF
ncbi:hypothetical protein LZ198_12755 [Myxococcus sp. K15C18031901]|uniref:hypothetical protein n=1 Tax=Myxococcus dinghuensis TaxID=2906761 RepID=UPI0020A807D5|nr:hypothetical protein [Myxococcus dinghuensis]MCP3099737.1 hypothetical protein [Myxococcus dinghuensis]